MESPTLSLLPQQFGPLQGVRILSSGTIIAQPFAAEMAAEMGAEVIQIERPGVGDEGMEKAGVPHRGQGWKPRCQRLDTGPAQHLPRHP